MEFDDGVPESDGWLWDLDTGGQLMVSAERRLLSADSCPESVMNNAAFEVVRLKPFQVQTRGGCCREAVGGVELFGDRFPVLLVGQVGRGHGNGRRPSFASFGRARPLVSIDHLWYLGTWLRLFDTRPVGQRVV